MPRYHEMDCYHGMQDIMDRHAYNEAVFAVVAMRNELLSRHEEIFRIQTALDEFITWWKAEPPLVERLSASERFAILDRDNFTCRYCGRSPRTDDVTLHVDHIISRKDGGDNSPPNLITACQDCNLGKGAKRLKNRPDDLVPMKNKDLFQ